MKSEMTAAEFRQMLKNGEISVGKKGRLTHSGGSGSTIVPKAEEGCIKPVDRLNQAKIKHPGQGVTEAQRQSERYKNEIAMVLRLLRLEFEQEYKFDITGRRKFRFDFMVPELKLGIEYEGIGFSKDGKVKKSRHTNVIGYTNDCTKYNLATAQGWRVLRYTAKNIDQITDDLTLIIGKVL